MTPSRPPALSLADLPVPPPGDAPTFTPLKLVLQPGGLGLVLTRGNVLVGRHSSADLRLPLPDVSRRHCRFLFGPGGWQIVDLESLNGVFVNGIRTRQAVLGPGDSIRIGGFTFGVQVGEASADDPADGDEPVRILPLAGADAVPRSGFRQAS